MSKRHKINSGQIIVPDGNFNDEQTEALIAAVESRPILWDPALKEYRMTRDKTTAWIEVVQELNDEHYSAFDIHAVQARWSNMRDQFTRSRRNALKKMAWQGLAADNFKTWKWYNRLMFLRPQENEIFDASESNFTIDESICENVIVIDEMASGCSSSAAATPTPTPRKRKARKRLIDEEGCSPQTIEECTETFKKAADTVEMMTKKICEKVTQAPDQFSAFGNTLGSFVADELRSIHEIAPLGAMQLRHRLMSECSKIISDWVTQQNFKEVPVHAPSTMRLINE